MFRRTRHELDDATVVDLLRLAPEQRHRELRRLAEREGLFAAVAEPGSGRWFIADAEDLAEGGAAQFLGEVAPTLDALGAGFASIADGEFTATHGQTVLIDGRPELIYTGDEAARGETWTLATVRTFGVVNRRLEAAGSSERLYAMNGGNDLQGVFLTERLARALSAELRSADRPYLPSEDDPEGERQRG